MDDGTRQAMRLWTVAQPTVSAYVGAIVRDFTARDDVLQDTAVAVIESFPRYDPARPFIAWAMGIAQNQVRLYLRRCHRDRLVFDEEMLTFLAESFESQAAEETRALSFLRECLQHVGGRARRLCELRYVQDLKPAAIGSAIGMSANSVAKALQRVRDQLRECIERKAAFEGEATP